MSSVLARNLQALARRRPELARRIRDAIPAPGIDCVTAADGSPVPRVALPDGPRLLHSAHGPAREAERLAAALPSGEYLVSLGMGGGYHLSALLARPRVQRLLVVERGDADLRALLQHVDLSRVLSDPRVHLVAVQDPTELVSILLSDYQPAVYRSVAAFPLPARVATDPGFFGGLADAVRDSLDAVSRDHTTQTRFGLRWHRNIVANLRQLADRPIARPLRLDKGDVLIAGAGPSLDHQMDTLRRARTDCCLVATDAAVGPLREAGLRPDIILSIDCQHVVYHHFMASPVADIDLALDIASPPFLARAARAPVFLCAGHPLSRYLQTRGAPFPGVDAAGGNVGYAAVSLADNLGARSVRLFGVDLCYPRALPYARGSFFRAAIDRTTDRTAPLEAALAAHVLGAPSLTHHRHGGEICYFTDRMQDYRKDMERLCGSTTARITQEPGLGLPLEIERTGPRRARSSGAAVAVPGFARRLMGVYAEELSALPLPSGAFPSYIETLTRSQRETLSTLMPLASALQAPLGYPEAPVLIEAAARLARSVVDRALRGA